METSHLRTHQNLGNIQTLYNLFLSQEESGKAGERNYKNSGLMTNCKSTKLNSFICVIKFLILNSDQNILLFFRIRTVLVEDGV